MSGGFAIVNTTVVLPEKTLIERIRRQAGRRANARIVRGIGDDTAVLNLTKGHQLLVTTDLCIEDVHFRRAWHSARCVGHRCLARGLSDIAAMGGEPVACFLSLGVPAWLPQKWVDDFVDGLLTLARRFHVTLAGGDISSSEKVVADIMVTGQTPSGKAVLRSGARVGDIIYVTGELGGSAAQLKRLFAGEKITPRASDRHFYPQPRLKVGQWLRQHGATAMIDLSDGLSTDLDHICEESQVSALLDATKLPIARNANLDLALHGGEDYELLLTVPKRAKLPQKIAGVRVTEIGEVQKRSRSGASIQFRDQHGRLRPLKPQGWQHFRKSLLTPD